MLCAALKVNTNINNPVNWYIKQFIRQLIKKYDINHEKVSATYLIRCVNLGLDRYSYFLVAKLLYNSKCPHVHLSVRINKGDFQDRSPRQTADYLFWKDSLYQWASLLWLTLSVDLMAGQAKNRTLFDTKIFHFQESFYDG